MQTVFTCFRLEAPEENMPGVLIRSEGKVSMVTTVDPLSLEPHNIMTSRNFHRVLTSKWNVPKRVNVSSQ